MEKSKKNKNLYFFGLLCIFLFFNLAGCIEEQQKGTQSVSEIKEIGEKVGDKIENLETDIKPTPAEKEIQKPTGPANIKEQTFQQTDQKTEQLIVNRIEKPKLEQKNALKIQMLKKDERVEIENWELMLENIIMENQNFYAKYSVYYDGKKIKEFEIENPFAAELTFANGKKYIVVVVFPLGEKPNALQTQVYTSKALIQSSSKIEIGQVQNSYVLDEFYPPPKVINKANLEVGQKIDGEGFSVYYTGIDKTKSFLQAEFKIIDDENKEITQIKLSNKQMVEIKFPNNIKYCFVLQNIDKETFNTNTEVCRIYSFSR